MKTTRYVISVDGTLVKIFASKFLVVMAIVMNQTVNDGVAVAHSNI